MRLNSPSENQKRWSSLRGRGEKFGGKLDFGGNSPKRCIAKTLPRYDCGSPSNDNTKPDLNSEHS